MSLIQMVTRALKALTADCSLTACSAVPLSAGLEAQSPSLYSPRTRISRGPAQQRDPLRRALPRRLRRARHPRPSLAGGRGLGGGGAGCASSARVSSRGNPCTNAVSVLQICRLCKGQFRAPSGSCEQRNIHGVRSSVPTSGRCATNLFERVAWTGLPLRTRPNLRTRPCTAILPPQRCLGPPVEGPAL